MQVNIVLFWYMNDWGKYGRAYEKIIKNLVRLPCVKNILCILSPKMTKYRWFLKPMLLDNISEKLCILTPNARLAPSMANLSFLKHLVKKVTTNYSLKYINNSLGFRYDNTILWVFPPHEYITELISAIPHKLLITQVVDNNTFLEDVNNEAIAFVKNQYVHLSRISDMVITSSKMNYEIFSKLNLNCYFFENAVDEIFLSKASTLPYKVNRNRPKIGYVGFISSRTDIDLLNYIARSRSEYDLIIAGPQQKNLNKHGILDLSNVFYEGTIPYNKVPQFLSTLDVCLIPHKDTPFSRSMSPLKLFQYLGSGRPIVSTPIAGIERWDNLISVAHDYKDFIRKIDLALLQDNKERSRKRIEAVKLETWDKRVNAMLGVILKHYSEKIKQKGKRYNATIGFNCNSYKKW